MVWGQLVDFSLVGDLEASLMRIPSNGECTQISLGVLAGEKPTLDIRLIIHNLQGPHVAWTSCFRLVCSFD
jgi:hypothetical protein